MYFILYQGIDHKPRRAATRHDPDGVGLPPAQDEQGGGKEGDRHKVHAGEQTVSRQQGPEQNGQAGGGDEGHHGRP